ncbi:hypothetical protein [Micromonospora sp. NPDC023956]|uniref:restriction endonuclease subunit S n=1 Tax=Micromonospora sp. NPDC023956 TaxID=3155722 RepID=UPI00340E4A13
MSDLPDGWEWARLDELVGGNGVFTDGDWVESKDQDPNGEVRLTQLADVGEGEFRDRSSRSLTLSKARELRCTFLEAGDVLVARMPEPLGRACIYPEADRLAVTVVDVCIIRCRHVDARWLMWWLNSPLVRRQVYGYQAGTTRKRISRNNLAKVVVPVPPFNEQNRIVAVLEGYLSRLDVAARQLRQTTARADRLREAWRQRVENDCQGDEVVRLGDLLAAPLRNGHSAPAAPDGVVRTLTLTAVTRSEFVDDFTKMTSADPRRVSGLWLEPGDILIQRSNTPDLVGTAALYKGPENWAIFPDLLIRVRLRNDVLPEFVTLLLQAPSARRYFRSRAKGLAGSMPKIDQQAIHDFEVRLPTLDRQAELVRRFDEVATLSGKVWKICQRSVDRVGQLRASLFNEALSGRLVPQDPNDEPASELLARIRAERAVSVPKQRTRARRTPKELPAPPTRVTGDDYQQEALPL